MKMLQRQDVIVRASYMIGNLDETQAQARNTVDFAVRANALLTTFNMTCALPGTELYHQALSQGKLKDAYWYMRQDAEGNFYNPPLAAGALELAELDALAELKRAYKKFYLRPTYFWHLAKVVFRSPLFVKHCLIYAKRILAKRLLISKARTVHLDGRSDGFVDADEMATRRAADTEASGQ
jgi:hypothetical protein